MDDLTTIIEHEVITILLHLHQNHGGLQRFYANLLASVGDVCVSVCNVQPADGCSGSRKLIY